MRNVQSKTKRMMVRKVRGALNRQTDLHISTLESSNSGPERRFLEFRKISPASLGKFWSAPIAGSKVSRAIFSKSLPGPDFLRYYPADRLMVWQPQGTLDDVMLDEIAEWLVHLEKASLPFKSFVDLSHLTTVAIRSRHLFEFARKRAEEFSGIEPVRTALFSDDWVAFGIACCYESLMENTLIEARAFRDLADAAEWLAIPVDVLTLKDKPAPHIGATSCEVFGHHR